MEHGSNDGDTGLAARLESLTLGRIPLVEHLGVRIARIDDRNVVVCAPLAPNRNHMGTGFAGSLASVATLAGWAAALSVVDDPDRVHVVAQQIDMRFARPVTGDFTARCALPDAAETNRVRTMLGARGKARIALDVELRQGSRVAATLRGRFVLSTND